MSPDILIEQRIPPPPGQEYPYHTMFPDISRQTVEVVVDTVKTRGLWTLPQDQGFELLRSMYARFSQEYGMPTPRLHQDTYEFYIVDAEEIRLPKVSLVSACHEYRHHMQKYGRKRFDDIEVDRGTYVEEGTGKPREQWMNGEHEQTVEHSLTKGMVCSLDSRNRTVVRPGMRRGKRKSQKVGSVLDPRHQSRCGWVAMAVLGRD